MVVVLTILYIEFETLIAVPTYYEYKIIITYNGAFVIMNLCSLHMVPFVVFQS